MKRYTMMQARTIPGYPTPPVGEDIELPDDMAAQLIAQGVVKEKDAEQMVEKTRARTARAMSVED